MQRLLSIAILLWISGVAFGQKQPNMVIFITDDQSQIDMGAYGNKDVHTPNMDKLAAEGMRFTKAYAATSMCTPSRSNMFTGLYPFRNGSQMNHFAINPGIKTLPHYLKGLGYRVVIAGKTHVSPKSAFPFEYISEEMGRYQPIEGRSDPKGETVAFIKDYFSDQSNEDQPLCLIVATWWPHVPWLQNKDYDPSKLNVPDYLIDTPGTRAALAAYYQSITEADNMLGDVANTLEDIGAGKNTLFMFFSDQGVQFPGAKWTAYDQGLRVPFIVKWPGKVKEGTVSDALISLTDFTPTLIDVAGGKPIDGLDGRSFADVFLGKKDEHRSYTFAETSVEPHYWYNYVPARSIITSGGLHYIRNYNYGTRFLTHIDAFGNKNSYYHSWQESADSNENARFLLNRYSYRQPEELYDLENDPWEMNNLAVNETLINMEATSGKDYQLQLSDLRNILDKELSQQGETEEMIKRGQLPVFNDNSYEIPQGLAAHPMSFNKDKWNPETLYVTGYIEGLDKKGVLLNYFRQFMVTVENQKIHLIFNNGQTFTSNPIKQAEAHLEMELSSSGNFILKINGSKIMGGNVEKDFTKINGGYVSAGLVREAKAPVGIPDYFDGHIKNLRFTMNKLNGAH